jgi:hypothetical protein
MSASLNQVNQPDVPIEIIPSHNVVIYDYDAKKALSTAKFRQ